MKKLLVRTLVLGLVISFFGMGCDNPTSSSGGDDVYSADVIIVGAGGAGMSAAIMAVDAGASVIVLEKSATYGGNTLSTNSGPSAAGSETQIAAGGIWGAYTVDQYITLHQNIRNDASLVRFLAEKSGEAINWLVGLGMVLESNNPRTAYQLSTPGKNGGEAIVPVLYSATQSRNMRILYNTRATRLIQDGGRVTGVIAAGSDGKERIFKGNSVVLATGGFGQSNEMVSMYIPSWAGLPTDEIAPTTGDGIAMAQPLGAAIVDMDQIQSMLAFEPTTKTFLPMKIMTSKTIIINANGERFSSEGSGAAAYSGSEGKGYSTDLMVEQPGKFGFLVFDSLEYDGTYQTLDSRGGVSHADTIEGLAAEIGVPVNALVETVNNWNGYVDAESDPDFGRTNGWVKISTKPFYAVKIVTGPHYCLGGLKINTNAQVLTITGDAIPGLYAAGEVTGGVHGTTRVEGAGLTDSIVFGRQAGARAAADALALEKIIATLPDDDNGHVIPGKGNFNNPDGDYEGTGAGRNGDITVKVTIKDKSIVGIIVQSNDETPAMFINVENSLIPNIITAQTLDVDTVSGSTLSSNGVINAVKNALGI
jgi:fumarate reductase flavoprotein subunit